MEHGVANALVASLFQSFETDLVPDVDPPDQNLFDRSFFCINRARFLLARKHRVWFEQCSGGDGYFGGSGHDRGSRNNNHHGNATAIGCVYGGKHNGDIDGIERQIVDIVCWKIGTNSGSI